VPDPGRAEQAIEPLHVVEVARPAAVALGHRAVVVEHAARIDQLIVAADEREQLAPRAAERVEVAERVGRVGDVARSVLRDLRVALDTDGVPVEAEVVLVPVELGGRRARTAPRR